MSDTPRRGPRLIEDGLESLPPAPAGPAEAPEIDGAESDAPPVARVAAPRFGLLARLFWAGFGGLFTMALGLWAYQVVEEMIARNLWLGRAALALALLAGAALLLMAARELAGLARLKRIDRIRDAAVRAHATRDRAAALTTLSALDQLYRSRAELAAERETVAAKRAETLDGDALIDLAERALMTPLDQAAEAAVRRGARDVAAATAIIPLPLLDVIAALAINLRMIRAIAVIYGGRAGWLGSLRLMRAVAAHLIAAGAIAVGEDLLGPAVGGGALAKLSRRFGEGVANGALTARIGVAAIEVCRPLPHHARPRPGVSALLATGLKGLWPMR
ncbi:TIGR01620 family protein [Pikeienuella sp. HZG-20]|uniref:TIGR01620 family protein n=1 Tax=Paludibacillus litoralis TaxID=3133267 RepID=UPI0030EB162C